MHVCDTPRNDNGLIGHTGFVGGALLRQAVFGACYNSASIAAIAERDFGTLVCAAAPGSMLEANRAPERDKARIDGLIAQLSTVRAERFVLISSIAVLEAVAAGDLTPTEGAHVMGLVETYRRTLETSELEARMTALEER